MNSQTTTEIFISYGPTVSAGYSETAQFVYNTVLVKSLEWHEQRQKSEVLGLVGAFNELFQVYSECQAPDWDGYGALPVSKETYLLAGQFLSALPLGTPRPSFGAEPDGHLTLEWYRSARSTLSISISPEGRLHYAALLGESKRFGTEPFEGDVPTFIQNLISKVALA